MNTFADAAIVVWLSNNSDNNKSCNNNIKSNNNTINAINVIKNPESIESTSRQRLLAQKTIQQLLLLLGLVVVVVAVAVATIGVNP